MSLPRMDLKSMIQKWLDCFHAKAEKHLHMLNKLLTVLKEERDSNTVVIGGLNTQLGQWIDLPDRKVSKEPLDLH